MINGVILWVDDEIEHLRAHIIFLEKKGYEVVTVTNGPDAIEQCKQRNFDIIMLDEMMPGLIVCYLLFAECSLGLIQWFDNSLGPNDSAFWSLFMAITGIIFWSFAYGVFAAGIFHSFKMRKRLAVKARFGGRYHISTRKTRDFNEIVKILKETVSEEIAGRKKYAHATKRAGR